MLIGFGKTFGNLINHIRSISALEGSYDGVKFTISTLSQFRHACSEPIDRFLLICAFKLCQPVVCDKVLSDNACSIARALFQAVFFISRHSCCWLAFKSRSWLALDTVNTIRVLSVADIINLSILANMVSLSHSATVNESLLFAFEFFLTFCYSCGGAAWAASFHESDFMCWADTDGVDLSEGAGNCKWCSEFHHFSVWFALVFICLI